LRVEDAGGQPQERVYIELLQQVAPHGLARTAFEEDVVRHDDGRPSVHLQQRLDVLQEVELFVLGGRPEILPLVRGVFLFEVAFFVHDRDAALLPERRT
jgi:hypothetical protein